MENNTAARDRYKQEQRGARLSNDRDDTPISREDMVQMMLRKTFKHRYSELHSVVMGELPYEYAPYQAERFLAHVRAL
jgi:hypothetical protein